MLQENNLIANAQAGDREALNELVSLYWQPIYRFISYKTGNAEDAQELTQETFLRVFRALPNYQKTDAAFKTYLSQIALNLVRDFWRKQGRSPVTVDLADYKEPVAENDLPEDTAINSETRETIIKLLHELPDEQRRTIELRIIAGLPVKETALAMAKSEAAVKMLQQRALKTMRSLLIARGIVETRTCGGES